MSFIDLQNWDDLTGWKNIEATVVETTSSLALAELTYCFMEQGA